MADFFRRPLRLSLREAVTLLLAARALGGVAGIAESEPLRRAAARLEQALGASGEGTARVAVQLAEAGEEHLAVLRTGIAAGRVVRLVYRSASRAVLSEREVDPWSLTAAHGAWYLQGYCRSARAPRDFRLDRIREVALVEAPARPRPATLPSPVYRPGPDDPEVVLDCDPAVWWLAEWANADAVEELGDDTRRITLHVDHLEWAARLVLRLEGHARVVAPPDLDRRVRELAAVASAQHRSP
jgi:proteasome accessory factor C